MYCRQCGSHIYEGDEFCTNCGFRPLMGNAYCQNCGVSTKSNQEMCVNCQQKLVYEEPPSFAGFWIRFAAYIIDGIIIGVPITIISFVALFIGGVMVESANSSEAEVMFIFIMLGVYLLGFLITFFYFAGMHASKWQATVGKRVLGLKVINENGGRISFVKGIGRYFALFVSGMILYIGFIMAGATAKKQALHDMMAGTLVVKSQ